MAGAGKRLPCRREDRRREIALGRIAAMPRCAIIFDLDDTLYPERAYTFSGFRAVAAAFPGRLCASFALYDRMRELYDTPDRGRVFNVIVEQCGCSDADLLVSEMVAAFRKHQPDIRLFPDAAAALDRLRGRYKLGLISDGFLEAQQAKVCALGLADRLDEIIITDQWGGRKFWKPHPRAFEEMAVRLDVAPSECAYVADNRAKDFIAPNALGWRTVLIERRGAVYTDATAPPHGDPGATVASLDELEAVLHT